ncbi:prepilin-type N-terminal cleavage/methylation domain-containing protein [bacterium]|nr:prepilin-type N-terminal cleavage/methylation domain-containing protein [bacterium]
MNRRNEKGYTSVELMISMVIMFITVALIYSIFFFSIRWMRQWGRRWSLPQTTATAFYQIEEDLRFHYCKVDSTVESVDSVAYWPRGLYTISGDSLYRNNWRMHAVFQRCEKLQFFKTLYNEAENDDERVLTDNNRHMHMVRPLRFLLSMDDTVRVLPLRSGVLYRNYLEHIMNSI